MKTIESTESPLEFACHAAKRISFTGTQIDFLQQIAALYGKAGTPESSRRGLDILDEARHHQLELVRRHRYQFVHNYPDLAADYDALGRHDIAMEIIDDSIRFAGDLRPKYRAETLTAVAAACHAIGEEGRCREVLRTIEPYIASRKRLHSIDDAFAGELVSLYLKLGDVDAARSIIGGMTGFGRAEALAELAFADPGGPVADYLDEALRSARKGSYDHSLAKVADIMAMNGQLDRASEVIEWIKRSCVRFEAELELAYRLFTQSRGTEAVEWMHALRDHEDVAIHLQIENIKRVLTMFQPEYPELVRVILDDIRCKIEGLRLGEERLAGMGKLVGLLASCCATQEAEALINELVEVRISELESAADDPEVLFNRVLPVLLFNLAMDIDQHGLRWDQRRAARFRYHLELFPVQRFADLHERAKAAKRLVARP